MVASSLPCKCDCQKIKPYVWVVSVSLVFLSLATCTLLVTLLLHVYVLTPQSDVCTTSECVTSAASLIQSMDLRHDPCIDFYSYACNGFVRDNPVPDDDVTTDHFRKEEIKVSHQLRVILETPPLESDPEAVKKTKAIYETCMNTTKIDQFGLEPLKNFLDQLGGWPIVIGDNWTPENDTKLEDFFAKIERIGFHMELVAISLSPDGLDPNTYRITLDQPDYSEIHTKSDRRWKRSLTDLLTNATEMQARTTLIHNLVKLLGNDNSSSVDKDIARMYLLEFDLEERFTPRNERKNFTRMYNKMTINQLHNLTQNSIDWLYIFQNIFKDVTNFTADEEIVVAEIDYLEQIEEIVTTYSRKTITNYVIWKAVDYLLDHLNSDALELLFQYKQKVNNITQPLTRWQMCLSSTMDTVGFAVGKIFVGQMMNAEDKESAQQFISALRETYEKMIRNSDWLDEITKKTALKKTRNMRQFVGYPDWILDDEKLNQYYNYVVVTENHFNNIIYNLANSTKKSLFKYRKPIDKDKWTDLPTTVNAYYEQHSNSIWFPAGILRPPFYSTNNLKAINYGSIGAIIGHEIGHAFDIEGSQFDEKGILREWWTDKSADEYSQRTTCYIDQYNDYCTKKDDNDTCLDGVNTLGENIADNTGIRCAFETYQRWVERNGQETKLPGLQNFSPDQIFFISYAQTWCENFRPDQWENLFGDDPHSPGRYRVQGTLSNYPPFFQAFNCARGPMNRDEEKCLLW